MAAKVAMVAVPTVLGIASIRVYTVSEEPVDGLLSREKLNVYTPVPQSARAEFVPEQPGIIQSGLTTARETIQPYVLAVKGACSSVKRGSVRLYHTGEDLFYYLKDPPPEFLPRFGTITMAGLLGMFMARKGSRFKRVALPLGLMSAGASVCYPAQAVAVVKVTGKKVYTVGQWSSTAVFSLLTPKPQEPVTKDATSSHSQAAPVPDPESAVSKQASVAESASSSTVPETEVSAESFPVLDEPAVLSEASSVTAAEISSTQTPTDPVEDSVSAETKNFTASEEIPTPDKSEELSDIKKGVEDVFAHASPAESTPSSESEVVEASIPENASVEVGPPLSPSVVAGPVKVESIPSSEESSTPAVANQPSVPVVESAESLPELADLPPVAAVEETPTTAPTTPPPPQQPAAENNKGGSGFKTDPALMDFGQSSPEDEDLYSTRS